MSTNFNKITLFAFILTSSFTSCLNLSCTSKSKFVQSYNSFIKDVEKLDEEGKNLETTDKEFDSYSKECYTKFREEMTLKERKDFWSNTLKYYVMRYGNLGDAMDDAESRFSAVASEDFNDFINSSGQEIKKLFKDQLGPKLKDGLDKLLNKAKEANEILKKEIDNLDSDLK